MLLLKAHLSILGRSQCDLARYLGYSPATVNQICNLDVWPKLKGGKPALQDRISAYLTDIGATPEMVKTAFNEAPTTPRSHEERSAVVNATNSGPRRATPATKDPYMLLRHYKINAGARQHFRITRDPFVEEMESDADVFLTDDIRYVRAAMRQTAKHGGMLGVVTESGGGKSTLKFDLAEWINASGEPIRVIEPYVIGMEDTDVRGQSLKADDLTGAIIRTLAPAVAPKRRFQQRAAQMHDILKSSAQIGSRHVVIIEEAHALATPTIKHLKRFYELQDGFKKLLSIILIGQTELEDKLSEHNPDVREVVQRMEMVKLPPLDNHTEAYLRHKFARVGLDFAALCADDVVDAIRDRLRATTTELRRGRRQQVQRSLCYPLAINNLVARAMNEAVKIGAPKVTGALIAAAARGDE